MIKGLPGKESEFKPWNPWFMSLNGVSLSAPSPKAQRLSQKRGLKERKSHRMGTNHVKYCLLDMTWQLCPCAQAATVTSTD